MKIQTWLGLGILAVLATGFGGIIYVQSRTPISEPIAIQQTIASSTKEIETTPAQTKKAPVVNAVQQTPSTSAQPASPAGNYYLQASVRVQKLIVLNESFENWLEDKNSQSVSLATKYQASGDNLRVQKANAMIEIINGMLTRVRTDLAKWEQVNDNIEATKSHVAGGYVPESIYNMLQDPSALESDISEVKSEISGELNSF